MDENALRAVIDALLPHRQEIRRIPIEQQNPYALTGLRKGDDSKQNLKKLLLFSIQWRGGPRLNLNKIHQVLSDFDKSYDTIIREILPNFNGQDSADKLYRQLSSPYIKNVGPKIAGVFLRDLVYYLEVWEGFLPYLYLPIDRHVRDLLVDRLQIFDDADVPGVSESYFTPENQKFQQVLAEIHTPRVDFDDLWFIGSQFCSFRKLCPICWIRSLCKSRFENSSTLSL